MLSHIFPGSSSRVRIEIPQVLENTPEMDALYNSSNPPQRIRFAKENHTSNTI
jgi:hypothetical protein